MKYLRPDTGRIETLVKEEDLRTIIVPVEDAELTNSEAEMLKRKVNRIKNRNGERARIFYNTDTSIIKGEETANICEINLGWLAKVLYEHERYSLARGFSDAEMDVLRAIEFHSATRVGVDEVMNSDHANDLAESTIYKALRTLQEKELIEKVRPGVYQYTGP